MVATFPRDYEVRVKGRLTASTQEYFAPLRTRTENNGTEVVTVLAGTIVDQAELTGILNTIDLLGLRLVEIRPST